jgi:ornithine cyclodeaminase/alanine dehydrogenase-like protein (mu-crystallin family)
MLFLTESDVRQLLPMPEAVRLMRVVFEHMAAGEALNQPRRRLILKTGSVLHYMAASDGKYFGAKLYSTHAVHGAHFLFLLYRAEDGLPLALFEANHLGQIRTGAASGLATQVLATPGADTVAIIGSGFQACTQLQAVVAAWPLKHARVWSRSSEKRRAFADEQSNTCGIPVEAVETAEEAVRGAGIVITATNTKDPVLESSWISPGTHINAMGSNQARRRELPADLLRRADHIVVDSLEQARIESGDLLLAFEEADWQSPRLSELAEVVAGRAAGRQTPQQITVFKSLGLAAEDVVAAGYIYEQALRNGRGREVEPFYS